LPVLLYRRLRYGYSFRRIALTRGKYAIVDAADYDKLSRYKWQAFKGRGCFYACRKSWCKAEKKYEMVWMHRLIINAPDGLFVDHINHDGLDNRKENLRPATRGQNRCNSRLSKGKKSSQYKGVYRRKNKNRWSASIHHNNKYIWLGYFDDERSAAKAYDKAARRYHGEFAVLNSPEDSVRK